MKSYGLSLAFSVLSLFVLASNGPGVTGPVARPAGAGPASNATGKSHTPYHYIMMKSGKLVEVSRGKKSAVKKDIQFTNDTTIHPNGAIDSGSGQSLQLKEGQYITMDGRIRLLKNMPHSTASH
jgi:hypothetical protein